MLGVLSLGGGGLIYLFQPDFNPLVLGTLIRIGALLCVICLAFPELMTLRGKVPAILFVLAAIVIFLLAARPKLSRILIGLLMIGVVAGGVMKWISKMTASDPRRRK